jgi:hypothetical protein
MVLNNDTTIALAECLGLNRQNVSVKLNGKREFKQSEIGKIIKRYNLTYREAREIFWTEFDTICEGKEFSNDSKRVC